MLFLSLALIGRIRLGQASVSGSRSMPCHLNVVKNYN